MKNRKILIVDDDPTLGAVLRDLLKSTGYEALTAGDGKAGIDAVQSEKPDLVISDIRMPGMTGIQLLQTLQKSGIKIPVVLMTAFSQVCLAKEAAELGAAGFLPKPFRRTEVLGLVASLLSLGPQPPKPNRGSDDFCKVAIGDFVSGSKMQFDIYIKLSNVKFIKIAHSGEDISLERLATFKTKGIHFLYMLKEDFSRYLGFNMNLARRVAPDDQVSIQKKVNLLRHTGEILLQQAHFDSLNPEKYEHAKGLVETSLSVLTSDLDAVNLLSALSTNGDTLYAQSVGVSMLSVALARQLGWTSAPSLFKVAMAGLFHDIGKKEFPPALLAKQRKDMTADEIKIFESHPARGLEILNRIKNASGDVIQAVYQHHEDCQGQGYPRGLTLRHIHPIARLIAVADTFCHLVMRQEDGSEPLKPHEAIRRMLELYSGRLDPEILVALAGAFNVAHWGAQPNNAVRSSIRAPGGEVRRVA
jgi:putative nucleotidyltransferase with HDIG domain